MDEDNITSWEGHPESNAGKEYFSTIVTETYHSIIELRQFDGRVAIIKRCRNRNDPRTLPRFRNEVDALNVVISHVGRLLLHHMSFTSFKIAQHLGTGTYHAALGCR